MNMKTTLKLVLLALSLFTSHIQAGQVETEVVVFYHNDILGSPVAATDANGNACWVEDYKPYGDKRLNQDSGCGIDNNQRGYTGHVHDKDIGLTYMQARYYDPVVGRFMGTDPVGVVLGVQPTFNRYAYGNNNPYRFVDPDGRNGLGILGRYGLLGLAFNVGLVTVDTAVVGKAALNAAIVSIAITGLVNGMLNEEVEGEESEDESGKTGPHDEDEKALQDMLSGDTRRGKRLSNDDADGYIDLANEIGNETRDDRGKGHWNGGEHIHIDRLRDGTGDTHIPTEQPSNEQQSNDQGQESDL